MRHDERTGRLDGRDCCRARPAVDHADLTKVVAGTEFTDLAAADGHAHSPGENQMERKASKAFVSDFVTLRMLDLAGSGCDSFKLPSRQLGEEIYRFEPADCR